MTMAIAGMLLFMRLQPDSDYVTDFLPGVMFASIGMGLTFVPVTLIATSGVPGSGRPRFGSLQHVAADRRRTGPRDPLTFAVSATGTRSPPWAGSLHAEDQAQALVDGFHVAYLGSALLIAVAAVFLFLLPSGGRRGRRGEAALAQA